MKNAGNACKYRLYRHIRTSKEIIKKSYLIYYKLFPFCSSCKKIFIVKKQKTYLGSIQNLIYFMKRKEIRTK